MPPPFIPPATSDDGWQLGPAPREVNQLESEEATGGARGNAAVRNGAGGASGSEASTSATGTQTGPGPTADGSEIAEVLPMKRTTLSKSSSSQTPPIQVASIGAAEAPGMIPTTNET